MRISVILFTFSAMISSTSHAEKPSVFFVHGANFSGKSWTLVQRDLQKKNIRSSSPDLYRSDEKISLKEASHRVCGELKKMKKPSVLVGHSQGGAIITVAAAECPELIRSLVYVAAVLPTNGAGVFDQLSETDNENFGICGTLNESTGTYDLKSAAACHQVFMQDASVSAARFFFKWMVNEPASIGDSKAIYAPEAIANLPKYYIKTEDDLIVSKETQDRIMASSGVRFEKVFSIRSSHTPFLKMHSELSRILLKIL